MSTFLTLLFYWARDVLSECLSSCYSDLDSLDSMSLLMTGVLNKWVGADYCTATKYLEIEYKVY